jgi:hypothetical protein
MQRLEMAYWVGGERAAGTGMNLDVIPAEAATGAVPGRDFVRTGTLTAPGAANAEGPAAYLMLFDDGDDPADWLRAGEALSAGWPEATGLGLSALPFSSIIEVISVRESLRRDILAGLGNPYIVIRLGVLRLPRAQPKMTYPLVEDLAADGISVSDSPLQVECLTMRRPRQR